MINTASAVGLTTASFGPYSITKHAIVAASEALYHGLASEGHKIGVSVLCPGWVQSQLVHAERNRQPEYRDAEPRPLTPRLAAIQKTIEEAARVGAPPADVAEKVIEALAEERFYILTDPGIPALINLRFDDILQGRKPTSFV